MPQMNNIGAIRLNSIVQRNEAKFLANKLGDELVMMNMENGDFITMNKVGADIWELTNEPIEVNELIAKLLDLYNTNDIQCKRETMDFLNNSAVQNIFIFKQ
jgi:hypothetical protein